MTPAQAGRSHRRASGDGPGLFPDSDEDQGDEVSANAYLTVVGRMTGRFLDDDWFRTAGRLHPL